MTPRIAIRRLRGIRREASIRLSEWTRRYEKLPGDMLIEAISQINASIKDIEVLTYAIDTLRDLDRSG